MDKNIIIKKADKDINKELASISFEACYTANAELKYKNKCIKVFNLKSVEANILKQLCLSLGFDAAVSRDTITCKCEFTDAIINGTEKQFQMLVKKLHLQPFRLKTLAKLITDEFSQENDLIIRNIKINTKSKLIMGILNVTPDSFSDGGKYFDSNKAIEHACNLIKDGADIIDIGGESTRPKAQTITPEEEQKRIIPVIKALRELNKNILLSIDTRNFETAKAAIEAGADIINDVSGLDYDKKLMEYICNNNIPIIIMHSDKVPAKSSTETKDSENDIVEEIYINLYNKIKLLESKGIERKNIIIDPGFGFGKSPRDSFEILKRIDEFSSLNVPILIGISRKSFIFKTFDIKDEELDFATLIYDAFLVAKNANIIRVHEVKKHKNMLNYLQKVL